MKYNEKYNRYLDNDFNVYYYDKKNDKLVQCKLRHDSSDYVNVTTKLSNCQKLHRLIWETFVGEIPQGYEIDHINTIRDDNRLENLRIVTHKENVNNPLSKNIIVSQEKEIETDLVNLLASLGSSLENDMELLGVRTLNFMKDKETTSKELGG